MQWDFMGGGKWDISCGLSYHFDCDLTDFSSSKSPFLVMVVIGEAIQLPSHSLPWLLGECWEKNLAASHWAGMWTVHIYLYLSLLMHMWLLPSFHQFETELTVTVKDRCDLCPLVSSIAFYSFFSSSIHIVSHSLCHSSNPVWGSWITSPPPIC